MNKSLVFDESEFKEFTKELKKAFGSYVGYYLPDAAWGEFSNREYFGKTLKNGDEIIEKFKRAIVQPEKIDGVMSGGILISAFLPLHLFICFKQNRPCFLFFSIEIRYSKNLQNINFSIIDVSWEEELEDLTVETTRHIQPILDKDSVPEELKAFLISNLHLLK